MQHTIETPFLRSFNLAQFLGSIELGSAESITASLKFLNSSNQKVTAFQSGVATSSVTYTWPVAGPSTNGQALTATTAGVMSWTTFPAISSAFVTIGNDAALTGERALTGTTNQITVTDNGANSTVVLSTPQNIDTGATPTFAGLIDTGYLDLRENSPSQITVDQNNYAIGNYSVLRLSTNAARTITGLAGGTQGRQLWIINVGSSNLVLAHQSGSSTSTNRIITASGADLTLNADDACHLWYDNTTQRWRILETSDAIWG